MRQEPRFPFELPIHACYHACVEGLPQEPGAAPLTGYKRTTCATTRIWREDAPEIT